MDGPAKIAFVESQLRAVRRGATNTLKCPFCDGVNTEEAERMCCVLFVNALAAVLDRLDLEETKEIVERISERAQPLVTLQ